MPSVSGPNESGGSAPAGVRFNVLGPATPPPPKEKAQPSQPESKAAQPPAAKDIPPAKTAPSKPAAMAVETSAAPPASSTRAPTTPVVAAPKVFRVSRKWRVRGWDEYEFPWHTYDYEHMRTFQEGNARTLEET